MSGPTEPRDKYAKAEAERQKYVDTVLDSPSRKKVVVAGPGTGKTSLFKEILKGKQNALALTFVTSLVEDLTLDLLGLAEVSTLHGYALDVVRGVIKKMRIFPKLPRVIQEDALVLLEKNNVDFDGIFAVSDDNNELIEFYRKRKDYYGKWYGFTDVIFGAVKRLRKSPERIRKYNLVVVDEFQDFNKLEVSLIDLLAQKSPVLLVGDDDQALYSFKDASPNHIRRRYSEANQEYASFDLPYCSRCTRVIVAAANDIISSAKINGHLHDRIRKPFNYFCCEEKDRESNENPRIVYKRDHETAFPSFIEGQLVSTVKEVKEEFSVLIISPYNQQVDAIVRGLEKKGLRNIKTKKRDNRKEATFLEGLCVLLQRGESKSNLGWRIIARSLLNPEDFEALLKKSHEDNARPIVRLLDQKPRGEGQRLLATVRNVLAGKGSEVPADELDYILNMNGLDPLEIRRSALMTDIDRPPRTSNQRLLSKISIQATTIQSSKGLSADYVFLTHFNDKYFLRDKASKVVSDLDICNLLVSITRAKKKVILVSSVDLKEPTFLEWIDSDRIARV